MRAPAACSTPGCPHQQPCPVHKPSRSPSSKATGRRDWRDRIRPLVLRRDNGICHICKQPGADQVDHLDPVSTHPHQALSRDLTRYAAAHARCNNQKGNR